VTEGRRRLSLDGILSNAQQRDSAPEQASRRLVYDVEERLTLLDRRTFGTLSGAAIRVPLNLRT
jgi:hypothetical protein